MEIIRKTVTKYISPLLKIYNNTSFVTSVRSVALAYKVTGDANFHKAPLIILHGLLGSKRNWDTMSKKLNAATGLIVVSADARNHGESPHAPTHTYKDLAGDVKLLMKTLDTKQAFVLGHSMGGRTAMALALTEPELVKALIVADISPVSMPGLHNDFMPKLLDAMTSVKFNADSWVQAKKQAEAALKSSGIVDDNTMGFLLHNVGKLKNGSFGWTNNVEILAKYHSEIASFPAELKSLKYDGPTLFVAGERSPYLPRSDLPEIRNMFPKANMVVVSGAGHNVHAEEPQVFLSAVQKFITSVV